MAFYEVVGTDPHQPLYLSADNLLHAKDLRDKLFATGKHDRVFIRQYLTTGERYRVLRRLTLFK